MKESRLLAFADAMIFEEPNVDTFHDIAAATTSTIPIQVLPLKRKVRGTFRGSNLRNKTDFTKTLICTSALLEAMLDLVTKQIEFSKSRR